MNASINPLTYWLLDTVVESPVPVHWLHPNYPDLTMALNRPHHGANFGDVSTALAAMSDSGWIGFYPEEDIFVASLQAQGDLPSFDEWEQIPRAAPRASIEAALLHIISLHYVLTPEGGAVWESMSTPKWERYSTIGGLQEVTIAAGDQAVADQLLACYPGIHESAHVIPESITWTMETPWRATYWKTLPTGWVVRFRTRKGPIHESASAMWRQVRELQRWYTNSFAPPFPR